MEGWFAVACKGEYVRCGLLLLHLL
jgi:hypothetical protein